MATVISVEFDNTLNQTAHFALTSLCGSHIADTAAMPIALFPFHYHGHLVWQQHLDAVSDPQGPCFHAGMVAMAEYAQCSFNLQHNITTTVFQQRLCMAACEERHNAISCELTQLMCENDLLRGGIVPPTD
jgi:hypothetical protein